MANNKYTVDLAGHMAECEANYARIIQLLPDMATVDEREFAVNLLDGELLRCHIIVTERCKYTTMIEVSQQPTVSTGLHWSSVPCFSLRVYHDAKMAEVTAYDSHRLLRAKYDYPNDKMYQRDEKAQLNQFLGEWLTHCLKYGRVLVPIMVSQ